MNISFIKNPIFGFIVKFSFLSLFFYYGCIGFMGITSPDGIYFPFLDKYLNFINWYRTFLLNGSHYLTEMAGYPSFIKDKYHLQIIDGQSIQIVYSCLGTGLLGVWFAFAISFPSKIKKKINWILIGFFTISFLNMIRLAALVIVANKINLDFVDHHTYFNIMVYICIIIMIYFYTREKKETKETISPLPLH